MAGRPCACGCGRFVWGRQRVHRLCVRESRGWAAKNAARDRKRARRRPIVDWTPARIEAAIDQHLAVIQWRRKQQQADDTRVDSRS